MIIRRVSTIWIILLLSLTLQAQTTVVDSLKDLLTQDISDSLRTKIASKLAQKYLFNDPKESLKYSYLAYETALKTKNHKAINEALLHIGNVYSIEETHNTALSYYRKILKNVKDCNNCTALEGETNMYIGQSFNYLGKYDSAIIYLYRADSLYQLINNNNVKYINYLFISEAEMNRGHIDTAMTYIRKCLVRFALKGDTTKMLNAMLYQAACYDKTGDYQKEIALLKRMLALSETTGKGWFYCRIENKLANAYLNNDQPSKAYTHLQKSISCLKKHGNPQTMADNLEQLSYYYASIGNYSKAIEYRERHVAYTDSLDAAHITKVKELFNIRYDMETKFKSLALLKRDNYIRDLNYKKNIFYKNISRILLLFFGLIFMILLYVFLVRKKGHKKLLEANRKLEAVHKELELKQQQQEQENQIRNKLFMILAHDLINPFNALLGFAELLSEEIHNFERKDIKRHSEFIFQAAKQLHFLLENLLHWARIQTNHVQYQPSYFELNKTIRDIAEIYRYMAEKKKITLEVNTQDDLIVYADESLISVVLHNLIHNAVKYTNELGIVTIEAQSRKDRVVVSVTDTGYGISEEEQKKLFNLEYHFTRKGTSGEEGTGLGLIICKEFLSIHSSSLIVESTPGEGSRFSFSLPVKK